MTDGGLGTRSAPAPPDRAGGDELAAAIDGLYETFRGYGRPGSFLGCACCWEGEPVEAEGRPVPERGTVLVAAPGGDTPLRRLEAAELAGVAWRVPLTAGSLEVRKHYLPRLLEIAAGPGFGWPDLEVVFSRLNDGPDARSVPWTEWPVPERAAVERFLHELWLATLRSPADDHRADSVLCGVGTVDPGIDWYLRAWLRFDHPGSAVHLHRFVKLNGLDVAKGKLWNAFWARTEAPAPENRKAVLAWLRSRATAEAVAGAAEKARDDTEREALEDTYVNWLPLPGG